MKILLGLILCIFAVNAVRVAEDAERVIGGNYVKAGDYPFNAAIHFKKLFLCSGALIELNKIVTTADCVHAYSTGAALKDLTIKLGSIKSIHELGVFEYPVLSVRLHENYTYYRDQTREENSRDFTVHHYNIAVITLTMSVIPSATVSPIALPASGAPPVPSGTPLTLVGWGYQHGLVHDDLQDADLVTMDTLVCLGISGEPPVNPGNMLCTAAFDPTNGMEEGACTMDHGGPLIGPGTIPHLQGLVSWADCEWETGGNKPTIYTNIQAHIGWLGMP